MRSDTRSTQFPPEGFAPAQGRQQSALYIVPQLQPASSSSPPAYGASSSSGPGSNLAAADRTNTDIFHQINSSPTDSFLNVSAGNGPSFGSNEDAFFTSAVQPWNGIFAGNTAFGSANNVPVGPGQPHMFPQHVNYQTTQTFTPNFDHSYSNPHSLDLVQAPMETGSAVHQSGSSSYDSNHGPYSLPYEHVTHFPENLVLSTGFIAPLQSQASGALQGHDLEQDLSQLPLAQSNPLTPPPVVHFNTHTLAHPSHGDDSNISPEEYSFPTHQQTYASGPDWTSALEGAVPNIFSHVVTSALQTSQTFVGAPGSSSSPLHHSDDLPSAMLEASDLPPTPPEQQPSPVSDVPFELNGPGEDEEATSDEELETFHRSSHHRGARHPEVDLDIFSLVVEEARRGKSLTFTFFKNCLRKHFEKPSNTSAQDLSKRCLVRNEHICVATDEALDAAWPFYEYLVTNGDEDLIGRWCHPKLKCPIVEDD